MEYTAQPTYCLWRVDGEKRVGTGGHESDGFTCNQSGRNEMMVF